MPRKPADRSASDAELPKRRSPVQFFDWKRSDPTKYAGVDGLAEELLTYKNHLNELLAREGAFVLIKGPKVVGIFDAQDEALAAALSQFNGERVLIKQIVAKEPIHSTGGVDC